MYLLFYRYPVSKVLENWKNIFSQKSPDPQDSLWVDDLFTSGNKASVWLKGSHLSMNQIQKEDDGSIISFINDIFLAAIGKWASDIHIEPNEKEINIRFRIDGNFVEYKKVDLEKLQSIIARVKILAYLRIDEQRLPQDGKINFHLFWWKSVDLRVSVLPNIYGEKVVIRILKKEDKPAELKDLWFLPYNMVKLQKHLWDTHGMILAVWPTGSGKSTTLFSLLSWYDAKQNNISTLEDPVEYRIPGVNHTQIHPEIGFHFSDGLRALLRQDPDIIMVGEIRDEETAKLAIESSITWHLVFSTLHTNSAVHTLSRLVNLWVDPLLISSSLRLIISQRLVRKLCDTCKVSYTPDEKVIELLKKQVGRYLKPDQEMLLYKPSEWGCLHCNHTWFKGRLGVYEILEVSEKIEELLLKNASRAQLEIQAIGDGMIPIKQDALLKVVLGYTSLEEALSVVGN